MKRRLVHYLPDSWYLRLSYRRTHGHFLRLHRPRTFNEKIQWLKLYYRDPLLTRLTDKYQVRQFIAEQGFSEILNEMYGIYESCDDIDFSRLPDRFVLKATHGSKMNVICKDKTTLDWQASYRLLKQWQETNYFYHGREWAYKNIKPRIICERYLENEEYRELVDYKFYCFNGRPELFFICTDRFGAEGVKYDAFDFDWNKIELFKGKSAGSISVSKPDNFLEMKRIVEKLCQGFPFVRVDLYSVENRTVFGELTFYPDCGMVPFSPEHYNRYFGDLLVLPEKRL